MLHKYEVVLNEENLEQLLEEAKSLSKNHVLALKEQELRQSKERKTEVAD